jgi:hypothetical protein
MSETRERGTSDGSVAWETLVDGVWVPDAHVDVPADDEPAPADDLPAIKRRGRPPKAAA